jgi:hypothetical protein
MKFAGSRDVILRRMPTPISKPEPLRSTVFAARDAIERGLLTRNQLRSGAWQRVFRGVWADADLHVTYRMRVLAAGQLLLPDGAVIAGRSAAYLYGAELARDHDPVDVASRTRFGPVQGLRVHRSELPASDLRRSAEGMWLTSPQRTCWDLAGWLPEIDAVPIIDVLIAKNVVSVGALRRYGLSRAGVRGWRKLLQVCHLADPGAQSPQESRVRVGLMLAGLPQPTTQYVIKRNGQFLARVDLAWEEQQVAVEYDGAWHGSRDQLERDRARLNRILGEEWIVLHITHQRFRDDFGGFIAEVKRALKSRGLRVI